MAKVRLQCPHCRVAVSADEACLGKRVRCPACKQTFTVPSESKEVVQTSEAPREEESPDASPAASRCPKCGTGNPVGAIRCAKCSTSLRPTVVGVVAILGTIASIGGVIVFPLMLFAGAVTGQLGPGPIGFAILLSGLVFALAQAFIYPGLGKGMYSAWIAVQIVWGINIPVGLLEFFLFPAGLKNDIVFGSLRPLLLVMPIIYALLWVYLYNERVRTFCSVGRRMSSRG